MNLRRATGSDAVAIASLHAQSWRESYRGVYSDAYLDGDVVADRRRVWEARLRRHDDRAVTIMAEDEGILAGFAHVIFDEDAQWGALLDNLHVASRFKRQGIGRLLMSASAEAVVERATGTGLFLWVLETNEPAQAFYRRLGGAFEGREASEAPGGGTVVGLRCVWRDPSSLVVT